MVVRPSFIVEVDLANVKQEATKELASSRTGVEISLSKESNWSFASALRSPCL